MVKQLLREKEILTLKKMVEPRASKQKLKEEEIKFIRGQIEQREETSKLEKREKEELQEEKLKVATEIKETESLEAEKHEEIPAQPIIEAPKLVKEPEKLETEIEKESTEEKPLKLKDELKLPKLEKKKFKAKLEKPMIEDVRIVKITDLWRKKPKLFSLESDAIIVTVKTPEGKKVKETFYAYISPDGTFSIKSGRTKTPTQQKFINFLQHYKLAENLEKYNVIEESKGWKGKPVELDDFSKIVTSKK